MHHILLALCLTLLSFPAHGWGFFAHQRINRLAVFSLPPEMLIFYKTNIEYITAHATDADKRRYIIAEEGPRHYIDIDHYGAPPFAALPRSWQEAVCMYTEDSLRTYGILPWYIGQMMHRLTQAFKDRDIVRILKLSADIGHYAGDAHVPLHACSNHNGQFTGQQGIHGLWESRIPELMADKDFNYFTGRATYIKDINTFTWQIVLESAAAADTVLRNEKLVSDRFPSGRKFAYEKRKGKLVRNYATAFTRAYQATLGDMVERRMRAAIYATANYWYTAWVNAGMPPLSGLKKSNLIQDTVPPITERMIGRQEG